MFRPERLPLIGRRQFMVGAAAVGGASVLGDHVDLRDFTPHGDGSADDGPAIQRAIDQAAGRAVWLPPGRYLITTPIRYVGRADGHAPGLQLVGAGQNATIFDCQVRGAPALFIDQGRAYLFTRDGRIEGIRFAGRPDVPEQEGIRLSGAWNYRLSNLQIDGFSSHGLSSPWREDLKYPLEGLVLEQGSPTVRSAGGLLTNSGLSGSERVSGPGISAGTVIKRILDDKTLLLSQPATESGTQTLHFVGNSDAFQSILRIEDTRIINNGDWGIWGGAAIGLTCKMSNIEVENNKAGGIYCAGMGWRIVGGESGRTAPPAAAACSSSGSRARR